MYDTATTIAPLLRYPALHAAHEERRLYRLAHPTPGEAALRALLLDLSFRILLLPRAFDYHAWRADPADWQLDAQDAIAEGFLRPYYCDIIIPLRRLIIEVEGRIHRLTRERDARRYRFLADQGLTVLILNEATARDANAARQHLLPALSTSTVCGG